MKIQCPHCAYTREMDDSRIPEGTLTAKCPNCGRTFLFSRDNPGLSAPTAVRLNGAPADRKPGDEPAHDEETRENTGQGGGRGDVPPGGIVREHRGDLFARPVRPSGSSGGEGRDAPGQRDGSGNASKASGESGASGASGATGTDDATDGKGHGRDDSLENTSLKDAWAEYWRTRYRDRAARDEDAHPGAGDSGPARAGADGDGSGDNGAREEGAEGGDGVRWSFNPWECAGTLQEYVSAFFQTCLRVMFAPQRFFREIVPRSARLAVAFFLCVVVLQTVVEHVWATLFFKHLMPAESIADPQLKEMATLLLDNGNLLLVLFIRCFLLFAQICIYTAIVHLCLRLVAPRQADFSVALQVLCYAQGPLLLCFIPGVGSLVGMIWSAVCALIGLRAALKLSFAQTCMGVAPLVLLILATYMRAFSLI